MPAGTKAFVGTLTTILSWQVVRVNLDRNLWTDAGPIGLAEVGSAALAAVLVAIVAGSLGRSIETGGARKAVIPSAGLEPGVRAVWMGRARAIWAYLLLPVVCGSGLLVAATVHPALGLVLCLPGLAALCFTSIRVVVDRQGIEIRYGMVGWPVQRISLADICRASVITVRPMAHGGWGYRGSLRLFRRAAIVLRVGEGIQLDLADDRRLVITVDGALEGAGVINDLKGVPARVV